MTAKCTHQYRWVYEYALQYVTVLKIEDENVDKLTFIFCHCIVYLVWWWISGSAVVTRMMYRNLRRLNDFFVGILQRFEELRTDLKIYTCIKNHQNTQNSDNGVLNNCRTGL